MDEERIDPQHRAARNTLRAAGIILLITGLVFTVIGFGSFFLSFAVRGFPMLFFFAFIGLPLCFVGFVLLSYGFMGKVTRYTAGETAPVAKDVINYTAEGTQKGVKTIASAIGEGLGIKQETAGKITCPKCIHINDFDAKFCDNCGEPIGNIKLCPKCKKDNDHDAKFCSSCGAGL